MSRESTKSWPANCEPLITSKIDTLLKNLGKEDGPEDVLIVNTLSDLCKYIFDQKDDSAPRIDLLSETLTMEVEQSAEAVVATELLSDSEDEMDGDDDADDDDDNDVEMEEATD